ncbi:MAG: hypothetical protein A2Y63_06075 [Candidatus Riflebacteria bacterium RBG_13_59_9]|nr:MAG: hypothetical protein A2Y63_06075 [Candidatus Riflebacteria bacterium RBG_13_59_9]
MPTNRQSLFTALTVLIAGIIFLFGFHNSVSPRVYAKFNPEEMIGFRHKPEKYASVGQGHLVNAEIWSYRDALIVRSELHYRIKGEPLFQGKMMERISSGVWYAAEIPTQPKGETSEYYITAIDSAGLPISIPENAPETQLPTVRWKSDLNLWVVLFHLVLLIGAGIYLMHALYYALLLVFGGLGDLAQKATASRAHAAIRWGWVIMLVGGVPLAIYITGSCFGQQEIWAPWPFGNSLNDSRTLYLLLFFGIMLLLRWDLFRFSPTRPTPPRFSNRTFGWLVLAGALFTLLSYAIPYTRVYR